MKEELLQYIWNYKKFQKFDFVSVDGKSVEIIDFGKWNHNSGPDFLMAKARINDLIFVGNIEIHIKASDWFLHQHSNNPEYQNLILHVVLINDCEISELKEQKVSTLEIVNYIDLKFLEKHQNLENNYSFIPCESIFDINCIPFLFEEETIVKKLDELSNGLELQLKLNQNNYEALLFQRLAYAFGLKVNSEIFEQLAQSIDFSVVQKLRQNNTQLESLFFGLSGFLDDPVDEQMVIWKREFEFIKTKFNLPNIVIQPKFSKLRPPNFPTIRLSQLANLYNEQPNLFSKLIEAKSLNELIEIFESVHASEYFVNRYNFGKISNVENPKIVSSDFISLILINAVLPVKYFYHQNINPEITDEVLNLYKEIKPESNSIIDEWKNLGVEFNNSLQTQAFLYHYKRFCSQKKCLNCSIGFQLLKPK